MHQLKKGQESFTVVEGPLAGRTFAPGKVYPEIPPGAEGKFEKIPDESAAPAPDPEAARSSRGSNKRGASDAPESGEVKS